MAAHRLPDVTIVADAGHDFRSEPRGDRGAGLSLILGAPTPTLPYVVATWRRLNGRRRLGPNASAGENPTGLTPGCRTGRQRQSQREH